MSADPEMSPFAAAARANLARHYARGLVDGSRLVLERLTDEHEQGPAAVTPETCQWARECLERLDVP